MGEHLIQYLVARFFAERWGFSLKAPPIYGIPRSYDRLVGMEYYAPLLRISGIGLKCLEYGCDVSRQWLKAAPAAHVQFEGFGQTAVILHEVAGNARQLLRPQFVPAKPPDGTYTLSCHYGRLLNQHHIPGHLGSQRQVPSYTFPTASDILARLEGRGCRLLHICTDRPRSPVWEEVGRHVKTQIFNLGALGNYQHVVGARNLIVAGTAFDWAASMASNADCILQASAVSGVFSPVLSASDF